MYSSYDYANEFCKMINKDTYFIINPLASPSEGAPALKYGDVNTETTSPGEVKGLINLLINLI